MSNDSQNVKLNVADVIGLARELIGRCFDKFFNIKCTHFQFLNWWSFKLISDTYKNSLSLMRRNGEICRWHTTMTHFHIYIKCVERDFISIWIFAHSCFHFIWFYVKLLEIILICLKWCCFFYFWLGSSQTSATIYPIN